MGVCILLAARRKSRARSRKNRHFWLTPDRLGAGQSLAADARLARDNPGPAASAVELERLVDHAEEEVVFDQVEQQEEEEEEVRARQQSRQGQEGAAEDASAST